MRKLILILFILPFIGFSQSETKIEYWENGRVLSQIQYVADIENGPFRYYHENGKVVWEGNFKHGKLIDQKCWDEKDNKIECE